MKLIKIVVLLLILTITISKYTSWKSKLNRYAKRSKSLTRKAKLNMKKVVTQTIRNNHKKSKKARKTRKVRKNRGNDKIENKMKGTAKKEKLNVEYNIEESPKVIEMLYENLTTEAYKIKNAKTMSKCLKMIFDSKLGTMPDENNPAVTLWNKMLKFYNENEGLSRDDFTAFYTTNKPEPFKLAENNHDCNKDFAQSFLTVFGPKEKTLIRKLIKEGFNRIMNVRNNFVTSALSTYRGDHKLGVNKKVFRTLNNNNAMRSANARRRRHYRVEEGYKAKKASSKRRSLKRSNRNKRITKNKKKKRKAGKRNKKASKKRRQKRRVKH